jgi:hypothetical protein
VALILAVNPGNQHSPTLARLARELPGCELIGAESCAVAIKAIKKRVPDVLLLPAAAARGEADLLTHLKSVPGGVLTLKLPSVESADPVDLARQIREMLTGIPAPAPIPSPAPVPAAPPPAPARFEVPTLNDAAEPGTSPHVLEAAATAISWIRARRAQWSEPIEYPDLLEADEPYESPGPRKPREVDEPRLHEAMGASSAIELSGESEEYSDADANAGGRFSGFMPRAAAGAVVVALAAAAILFWPRGEVSPTVQTNQEPAAPPPAATPEPSVAEPLPSSTGWVAVTVPFEVAITVEGQPVTLDGQGRVVLAAGKHRLRLQNSERGYDASRTVQVRPGETTPLELTPETTIGVTANEPAEVLIDGTRVGETPYEGRIGLGTHTVTVKTAGAERQLTVDATSKPVRLEVDFSKP